MSNPIRLTKVLVAINNPVKISFRAISKLLAIKPMNMLKTKNEANPSKARIKCGSFSFFEAPTVC